MKRILTMPTLKSLYLIFVIIFVIPSAYSQTTPPKNAKLKTIIYSDYSITGYIAKKEFVNGQRITIVSLKTKETIICGDYFANSTSAYVNGNWYRNSPNGTTITNGLFEISNSSNKIGLTTKKKDADSIQIITSDVFSYKGFRNTFPILLEKLPNNNYSLIVNYDNDKKKQESNGVIKLEITVDKGLIKKYGFYSIDDFIFYTTDIKQTFANGDIFIGKINNTSRDENNLINYIRKEGKFIHPTGNNKEEELIKQANGKYKYVVTYADSISNSPFSKLEIFVAQNLIDKYGYWAISDYVYYTTDVKYTYKNGNIFIGSVENTRDTITNNISSRLTKGVLIYSTGEKFSGDLNGQWYCDMPISGEMTFTDGSVEEGNWVEEYSLNNEEYSELLKKQSPTEKLTLAKEFYNDKIYQNAIAEAETALSNENYSSAKSWYSEALQIKPEKSDELDKKISKIDNIYKKQRRKQEFINKYGYFFGNKISEGELAEGMSQEMVNEVWNKNFFYISSAIRNGNRIEAWEFSKDKMQMEIIKEGEKNKGNGGGDAAMSFIFMMNLSEQLGGPSVPRALVFTNNKLTDIYR